MVSRLTIMNWISSKGTHPWKRLLPMGSVYKQIRQSFLSGLMILSSEHRVQRKFQSFTGWIFIKLFIIKTVHVHKSCANSRETTSWYLGREGVCEVPLAKELLPFGSCWQKESWFSLVIWCLVGWSCTRQAPLPRQTSLSEGKENTKRRNFKSLVGENGRVKGVVLGGVWEGVYIPKIYFVKFSRN